MLLNDEDESSMTSAIERVGKSPPKDFRKPLKT
jgi:hypothetical protein